MAAQSQTMSTETPEGIFWDSALCYNLGTKKIENGNVLRLLKAQSRTQLFCCHFRHKREGERHKRKRDRQQGQPSGGAKAEQYQAADLQSHDVSTNDVASPSKRVKQEYDNEHVSQVCSDEHYLAKI